MLTASKSGGIAGVSDSLVVSSSGRARTTAAASSKAHHFRLSTKRLHALKRHIRAADFPHLKSFYGPTTCSDAFEFRLTHDKYSVTVVECGTKLPRGLRSVLSDAESLLAGF